MSHDNPAEVAEEQVGGQPDACHRQHAVLVDIVRRVLHAQCIRSGTQRQLCPAQVILCLEHSCRVPWRLI